MNTATTSAHNHILSSKQIEKISENINAFVHRDEFYSFKKEDFRRIFEKTDKISPEDAFIFISKLKNKSKEYIAEIFNYIKTDRSKVEQYLLIKENDIDKSIIGKLETLKCDVKKLEEKFVNMEKSLSGFNNEIHVEVDYLSIIDNLGAKIGECDLKLEDMYTKLESVIEGRINNNSNKELDKVVHDIQAEIENIKGEMEKKRDDPSVKVDDNTLVKSSMIFDYCKEGNIERITDLIEADSSIVNMINSNFQDWTPIYYAVDSNKYEVCCLLIDKGANVNHTDSWILYFFMEEVLFTMRLKMDLNLCVICLLLMVVRQIPRIYLEIRLH